MSTSGIIPRLCAAGLFSAVLLVGGCNSGGTSCLTYSEVRFLSEDIIELMGIVYQTGENGFLGDPVQPGDVVSPPGSGNAYTVTYDLPEGNRLGLGYGFGRASLQVDEDGVVNETPLAFSFGTTDALEVVMTYTLRYQGETASGRLTDTDFTATLLATRGSTAEPFLVEYLIDGSCFLGATFCEMITRFRSPGSPRNGLEIGFGDGAGLIDDPDVFAPMDLNIDYDRGTNFRARGKLGDCARYDERIYYSEIF